MDGRTERPNKAEVVAGVIGRWFEDREGARRPVNVQELWNSHGLVDTGRL